MFKKKSIDKRNAPSGTEKMVNLQEIGEMIITGNVKRLAQIFQKAGNWDTRETAVIAIQNMVGEKRDFNHAEMIEALRNIELVCKFETGGGSYRTNCLNVAQNLLRDLDREATQKKMATKSPQKEIKYPIQDVFGKSLDRLASGKMERRVPMVKTWDELLGLTNDLEYFKGLPTSNINSRLLLYRSALTALIKAGGGAFIIFECKERPDCYVQFCVVEDTSELCFEVSGNPVSERGHDGVLLSEGFKAPDKSNPNYSLIWKFPQPQTLAELVEKAFKEVLECPDSYTAHVSEAGV